jgi:hypothetical protein
MILFLISNGFLLFLPRKEYHVVKALDEYLSPSRKIMVMLKQGRDNLRVKYREVMDQRRVAENQVRAVEKSRAMWRTRAEAAEAELNAIKKKLNRPK